MHRRNEVSTLLFCGAIFAVLSILKIAVEWVDAFSQSAAHATPALTQLSSTKALRGDWPPSAPWHFRDGIHRQAWSEEAPGIRLLPTAWYYEGRSAAAVRRRSARRRRAVMRERLERAGLPWPPAELLLRAYKAEGELELWGSKRSGQRFVPILTWKLCALSGELGPKRREGDRQVPEGIYHVDLLNPRSSFHLSMRINYPNRADRILGDPNAPGSAIMVHGDCASVGCLAMSDERIEELWVLVEAFRRRRRRQELKVYLFPTRAWDELMAYRPLARHHDVWRALKMVDERFVRTGRPPRVQISREGDYRIVTGPPAPSRR